MQCIATYNGRICAMRISYWKTMKNYEMLSAFSLKKRVPDRPLQQRSGCHVYMMQDSYDLIIPDRMLPETDGLTLLLTLRARMSHLVNDLLLPASSDSDYWGIKKDKIDMDTLLLRVYETYKPVCLRKKIPLKLSVPDDCLPAVWGEG